jgi:hypothetical protein
MLEVGSAALGIVFGWLGGCVAVGERRIDRRILAVAIAAGGAVGEVGWLAGQAFLFFPILGFIAGSVGFVICRALLRRSVARLAPS